jgi:hypothetical protein
MNKLHTTIKFEYEYSTKTVHNFLDTRIYVNEQNKLESDVYSCQLVGRGGQILTGRGGGVITK